MRWLMLVAALGFMSCATVDTTPPTTSALYTLTCYSGGKPVLTRTVTEFSPDGGWIKASGTYWDVERQSWIDVRSMSCVTERAES